MDILIMSTVKWSTLGIITIKYNWEFRLLTSSRP